MKLYSYWRSSAAYRVRIGLNLKNIPYEQIPVHLVKDGGEHLKAEYTTKNPQGLVPALELDDGTVLTQSLAILEYLDDLSKENLLLPTAAIEKAKVRALAQAVACDIHPVNNLRILKYLSNELGVSEEAKNIWYRHWIEVGFAAIEKTLKTSSNGSFCFGHAPTLADICLIPQVYNAHRFKVDMTVYPLLSKINEHCLTLEAFAKAAPQAQSDANT